MTRQKQLPDEKDEPYKNVLIKNVKRFGLNAEEISKINQSVLVREVAKDLIKAEKYDIADTK